MKSPNKSLVYGDFIWYFVCISNFLHGSFSLFTEDHLPIKHCVQGGVIYLMNTFAVLEEPTVLNLKLLFSPAYPSEAQNVSNIFVSGTCIFSTVFFLVIFQLIGGLVLLKPILKDWK